jgi:hypothetical protein
MHSHMNIKSHMVFCCCSLWNYLQLGSSWNYLQGTVSLYVSCQVFRQSVPSDSVIALPLSSKHVLSSGTPSDHQSAVMEQTLHWSISSVVYFFGHNSRCWSITVYRLNMEPHWRLSAGWRAPAPSPFEIVLAFTVGEGLPLWGLSASVRLPYLCEACLPLWGLPASEACVSLWGLPACVRLACLCEACVSLWGLPASVRLACLYEACLSLWGLSSMNSFALLKQLYQLCVAVFKSIVPMSTL